MSIIIKIHIVNATTLATIESASLLSPYDDQTNSFEQVCNDATIHIAIDIESTFCRFYVSLFSLV